MRRVSVQYTRRCDPILPLDFVRRLKGKVKRIVRPNAQLMEDEQCGKRCVTMTDVERDGFSVKLSRSAMFGVIKEDKLSRLPLD